MAKTGRAIIAVVAGALVWALLWVGGTQAAQAAFPSLLSMGQPVTSTGALVGLLVYSVALSVLAGYVTASVAAQHSMPAVWALAILQLAIGIGVEASAWRLTPVWYHIVFLMLIVPATLYGGRLRVRRARPAAALSPSR
ncbi:MAG TPA: hypothetical protein VJ650_00720 [Gemmatimonadaceae bacterium]|nr:hypothetical protein [Gemmatimonadaceae bacterium]